MTVIFKGFNIFGLPDIKLFGLGLLDKTVEISSNILRIFVKNNWGAVLKIVFIFIVPTSENLFIVPLPLKNLLEEQSVVLGVTSKRPAPVKV